ncbi:hypothetical protein HG536_0D01130 [Torulaspora globosa]|uniref:Uncharacterized protein n=1 Tax=Torulaspora globosa TaxID=48254 RepID=A0A7G3ZGF5_9SACH|nr:uncharacterized protein HG536_0D01130 [Torulaspora globosa]QLL32591.1 hypothetical protein HG536_0D01130 [Torulaspora globosa]
MDWDQIKQLIASGQLDRLHRDDECARRYREHRRSLGKVDLSTYVLRKLQWSSEEIEFLNSDRYKTREQKIEACFSSRSLYSVTRNDFPYDFEPDVHHLLVWSKIGLPLYGDDSNGAGQDPETRNRIDEFFRFNLEERLQVSKADYCWFVNYSSLQSIRKISHVHLLVKTRDRELVEGGILGEPGLQPLLGIDGTEETQESCL